MPDAIHSILLADNSCCVDGRLPAQNGAAHESQPFDSCSAASAQQLTHFSRIDIVNRVTISTKGSTAPITYCLYSTFRARGLSLTLSPYVLLVSAQCINLHPFSPSSAPPLSPPRSSKRTRSARVGTSVKAVIGNTGLAKPINYLSVLHSSLRDSSPSCKLDPSQSRLIPSQSPRS